MSITAMFRIQPIPADQLDAVRRSGIDVSGRPVETLIDATGEPLRCCLRNAKPGEKCILFGYEPPIPGTASPYREIGPVLTHADDCGAPTERDSYPREWQGRPQVLRAYDQRGWIHPATTTHDGSDPAAALARVLAQPGVTEVHSRNIAYGCFMFSATSA
jgi:Protein of unknown function (DUF1203)